MQPPIELVSGVLTTYQIPDDFKMKGWVYVLSNEAMPGIFKIGMTTNTPEVRARELSQGSGVPMQFVVEKAFFSDNPRADEAEIHEYLAPCRINASREFFQASMSEIDAAFEDCGFKERSSSVEELADSFDVISFNNLNELNVVEFFEEIGLEVFGDKLAAAECMLRLAANIIIEKNQRGLSTIFHGQQAFLIKDYTQQNYEDYLLEKSKLEVSSGAYGPSLPGGY